MLTDRIIGRVGADILAKRISSPGQPGDSAALFRLDKLSSTQIAAVARAIVANPDLHARVDLMIPEALVDGQGLQPEILIPTTPATSAITRRPSRGRSLRPTATSTTWQTRSDTSWRSVPRRCAPTLSPG